MLLHVTHLDPYDLGKKNKQEQHVEWQNSHDLPVAFVWVPSGMINAHGRGGWQTASILRLNKSCNVMKHETVLAHTCVEQVLSLGIRDNIFV